MSNDDTLLTYITEGLSVISETMINRPLLSTAAPADAAVDGGVGKLPVESHCALLRFVLTFTVTEKTRKAEFKTTTF